MLPRCNVFRPSTTSINRYQTPTFHILPLLTSDEISQQGARRLPHFTLASYMFTCVDACWQIACKASSCSFQQDVSAC